MTISERSLLDARTHTPPKTRSGGLFWVVFPTAIALGLVAWIIPSCNADHASIGKRRFDRRDYNGAVEELAWAVKRAPDDVASRFLLARAQFKTGGRFDAKANLREVRKHQEFRKEASVALVNILVYEKNFDAADAVITEELLDAPDDATWLETRGFVTLRRADHELAQLAKQLAFDVGDAAPWMLRRIVEARTREQPVFEEWTESTAKHLKAITGIADAAPFLAASARSRELALRAEADLTRAAATNPLAYVALFELGTLAADRGDVDLAHERLTRLLAIDDKNLKDAETKIAFDQSYRKSLELLTLELERAGKIAQSVAILEDQDAKDMLNVALEERLGRQQLLLGMHEKVARTAASILERDPRSTWASYLRGAVAAHAGKHEDAVVYYNRAQIQSPTNALINATLARALVKVGRDSQAAEHFRIAMGHGLAHDVDVIVDYASVLSRIEPIHAAQYIDSMMGAFRDPSSKEHQRLLAELKRYSSTAGIGATTLEEARKALIANPDNVFARLLVAKMEHEAGLATIALPRCQEVTQKFPGLADGWLLQAQILDTLDRDDEALASVKRAAALRGDDPNIPWIEGRIAKKHGDLDGARNALVRALEIDPKVAGARLDLMDVEAAAKNFDAALRHGATLVERYPDDPRVHRGIGFARLAMNDPAAAVEPLRKAVAGAPQDVAARVKLATALAQSGAKAEARSLLAAIARDPTIEMARRRESADALFATGWFADAAGAYESLMPAATEERERVALSEATFFSHAAAGDVAAALDDLVRMRLAGRKTQSMRVFSIAASRAGFHREAAAQADLLRTEDGHDAASLAAALASHLALEQWAKAMEDIADLTRLAPETAAAWLPHRGRALLGLRKFTEAADSAEQAAASPGALGIEGRRLKLSVAIAQAEPDAIVATLRDVMNDSPGDPAPRIAAARALAAAGEVDKAAAILRAPPPPVTDVAGTLAAAAILVGTHDAASAATLLDAAPQTPRLKHVRSLVALLLGQPVGPEDRFAHFLDRIAKGDFEEARALTATLPSPPAIRDHWATVVTALAAKPAFAATAALELARARIYIDALSLPQRADEILRAFAPSGGADAVPFDLVRAWWKLESGEPRAAADIVVPMLETKGSSPVVVLIASIAGMRLSGEGAPMKLIDASGAPAPLLLSSVFQSLAANGHHATALKVYARMENPGPADRALRFLIAAARRELAESGRLVGEVPPDMLARPSFAAARLWVATQIEKTRPAAARELKAILAVPEARAGMDADLLYEAALLAGLQTEAATLLAQELAKAPYSAETAERFAAALRRVGSDKNALAALEDRLRTLDPTLALRVAPLRPIAIE